MDETTDEEESRRLRFLQGNPVDDAQETTQKQGPPLSTWTCTVTYNVPMENSADVEGSSNWAIEDVTGYTLLGSDLDSVRVKDQIKNGGDTVW